MTDVFELFARPNWLIELKMLTPSKVSGDLWTERLLSLERQMDLMMSCNQHECIAMRKEYGTMRRHYEELDLGRLAAVENQARELDKKFHECFDEVAEDGYELLRREVAEPRALLSHHSGEFQGIRRELKQVYEDMDELEQDIWNDIPDAAPQLSLEHDAQTTELQEQTRNNRLNLDIFGSAFEPTVERIYVRMQQGEERLLDKLRALESAIDARLHMSKGSEEAKEDESPPSTGTGPATSGELQDIP